MTVMVATMGAPVALVAANPPISPLPMAESPMAGALFVHAYVVVPPVLFVVKVTGVVFVAGQTT